MDEPGIYLDANATAPLLPEVARVLAEAHAHAWANPASLHGPGRAARAVVEAARAEVAALVGAAADEVHLASGAAAANRGALAWALARARAQGASGAPPSILASAVEHPSLRDPLAALARGGWATVRWLGVDRRGCLDLDEVAAALAALAGRGAGATGAAGGAGEAALLTVQWANSETGVLQPIAAIGALAREHGVPLHVDAAQAAGRIPIAWEDAEAGAIDLLSLSARKLHGPGAAGALVVRRGRAPPAALAGTIDAPTAAGFGAAARLASDALAAGAMAAVEALRDRLERGLRALGAEVHGSAPGVASAPRLPNTTSVRWAGTDGATLVLELARRGIACATGSACQSAALEPSHVLTAMGLDARAARGAVRFSLSRSNTEADIDGALAALAELLPRLRRLG